MKNCEALTSSPHSFAYSYRLVKKCFLKIRETSKCHNFLIIQPIFIRYSLLCLFFTLSSEIKLNLLWSSSLKRAIIAVHPHLLSINSLHFHLLLESAWSDVNQTWQELSFIAGNSKLFKWNMYVTERPNYVNFQHRPCGAPQTCHISRNFWISGNFQKEESFFGGVLSLQYDNNIVTQYSNKHRNNV